MCMLNRWDNIGVYRRIQYKHSQQGDGSEFTIQYYFWDNLENDLVSDLKKLSVETFKKSLIKKIRGTYM